MGLSTRKNTPKASVFTSYSKPGKSQSRHVTTVLSISTSDSFNSVDYRVVFDKVVLLGNKGSQCHSWARGAATVQKAFTKSVFVYKYLVTITVFLLRITNDSKAY